MKVKKHSMLFKGIVMVVAFMLTALCFPVKELVALAVSDTDTDYNFLTIGDGKKEVETVVNRGGEYTIPDAYIGGNTSLKVGDSSINETDSDKNEDGYVITASSVKVSFNDEVDDKGVLKEVNSNGGEKFTADRIGTYTVTYSYSYYAQDDETKTILTNSHQLKVKSVLSSASFDLTDPNVIFPDVVDLSVKGAKEKVEDVEKPKNVYLPTPKVTGENGKEIAVKLYKSLDEAKAANEADFVVVTATGGVNNSSFEISKETEGTRLYIDGSKFEDDAEAAVKFGAGTYTIKYSYYTRAKTGESLGEPYFVTSTTKSFKVYNDENNPYYKNFDDIKLELSKSWVDNGKRGEESTLPTAIGVTPKDATPAGEEIAVSYKVQVRFKEKYGDSSYTQITPEDYPPVTDEDGNEVDILEEDGEGNYYLADPTKFTPLKDGYYTFIYKITDFYGHEYETPEGVYKFDDVKDEKDPTVVLYDASQYADVEDYEDKEHKDEHEKLKTYATSNGVIVYAIGMNDNVTKTSEAIQGVPAENENSKVRLTRKIMRGAETILEINEYNKYNLVFNYRDSSAYKAYQNFLTNNFLVRKAVAEDKSLSGTTVDDKIKTDKDMLQWLQKHNYLIVVDNANAEKIYEIFNAEGNQIFDDIDSVKNAGDGIEAGDGHDEAVAEAKKNAAIAWLKSKAPEVLAKGFAYIDTDKTFGADEADDGTGRDNYYIHYIATDAAGNTTDVPYDISIVLLETEEQAPEIRFSTTLQKTYLPNSVVTFNVPTATDNRDAEMQVVTLYRFLDGSNKPIKVKGKNTDEDGTNLKGINLSSLWTDINEKMSKGMFLTDIYKAYHEVAAEVETEDGYIDLTDSTASSYSIDLSECKDALSLQIFSYVYDDCGNVGIYAETISILNSEDNAAPKFISATGMEDVEYLQDEDIELPTITVQDDAIGFVDYEVKLFHIEKDGTETEFDNVIDTKILSRRVWEQSKSGELKLYAGKFNASASGNYQARISIIDSKKNTIVYFANYYVKPRVLGSSIQIEKGSISIPQSVELYKDTVFIPDPTVTYSIKNSVTYDIFKANSELYKKETASSDEKSRYNSTDYVILGVDSNGRAYDYYTNQGIVGSFTPKEEKQYEIQYTVNVTVYDFKNVTYTEDGGYFTNEKLTKHKIYTIDENTFKVVFTDSAKPAVEIFVVREGDKFSAKDSTNEPIVTGSLSTYELTEEDLQQMFRDIQFFQRTSDVYYVTAQDTIAPTLREYEYVENISIDDLKNPEKYDMKLDIYGIECPDEDIDWTRSLVTVSGKLADGKTVNPMEYKGSFDKKVYEFTTDKDATYTINYTVYDKSGHRTSKDYKVVVGDAIPPEFKFLKENIVKETYKLEEVSGKKRLEINLNDIEVYDSGVKIDAVPEVTLYLGDDKIEEEDNLDSKILTFELKQTGNYTLTFTVTDTAGNKTTYEKKFTVEEKTQDAQMVYQTVGTILIVVSVVVLAGVIIYFIVSKVKLDKELKK